MILDLPAGIGQLSGLRELNLAGNRLAGVPAEIAALGRLEELRLDGNRITGLPTGSPISCSSRSVRCTWWCGTPGR
jgi:Leucine-rich repeat (LRR) protein